MGWPKKEEGARIYKNKGEFILVIASEEEDFRGPLDLVHLLDPTKWSVKRKGECAHIMYDGVRQVTMGPWTTLCFSGTPHKLVDATDEEVLRAYLGDENIYTGEPKYSKDPKEYHWVKGECPVTWGSTAKRMAFADCPEEFQQVVRGALRRLSDTRGGSTVEECRGLHRV